MKSKLKLNFCLAVILASGSTSFGTLVPEWRGTERSTYQEWSFSNDSTTPVPDSSDNPGDPLLRVTPIGDWIPDPGAWPLSGEIDVYIPNFDEPNPEKEIWLQLTWQPGGDLTPFLPDEPVVGVTPYTTMSMSRQDTSLNGWTESWFVINLYPNPPAEWITIKGDIIVDHLVIDTRCVPEPATVALLGFGALVVFRRKRLHA
ncbi:MAG: PEP-CTERM sorting domain-containing protein [Planctomycetota bacterium]|jgi:hypothetical protein